MLDTRITGTRSIGGWGKKKQICDGKANQAGYKGKKAPKRNEE